MLDFQEVQRRIMQRHCDCGACSPDDVPHSAIVEPIIMQLDSSTETLLLTPNERCNLASLVRRQSEMLDRQSAIIDAHELVDALTAKLHRRVGRGLIVTAVIVAAALLMWVGHLL